MPARRKLPQRRRHIAFGFKHGLSFTCGVGLFEDDTVAEIFLNASTKADSDLDVAARDAAVAASIALQYGATIETLYKSMTRLANGSAAGPLGHALGMIVRGEVL